MTLTPEAQDCLLARVNALETALREYADHQAWRCAHQDRWPWDDDCQCGLLATLTRLGLTDALEPFTPPPGDATASPSRTRTRTT